MVCWAAVDSRRVGGGASQGASVQEDLGRLLVTGANGHLGRRLIERVLREGRSPGVEAVVRSARAAAALEPLSELGPLRIHEIDPKDSDAMTRACEGCARAVHLVGILKEAAGTRYEEAHEQTPATRRRTSRPPPRWPARPPRTACSASCT
jgi:uncharacterized protein YbjT (DUF2867 family)